MGPAYTNCKECIVGNIINKNYHGTEKAIVSGTKHFAAGTKVYCVFMFGGTGYERVRVLGRHRISGRMIDVIMSTAYIKNFRSRLTCNKRVIEFIKSYPEDVYWPGMIEELNSRPTAEILNAPGNK